MGRGCVSSFANIRGCMIYHICQFIEVTFGCNVYSYHKKETVQRGRFFPVRIEAVSTAYDFSFGLPFTFKPERCCISAGVIVTR